MAFVSSSLSLLSFAIAILVGVGTLRQRANEPNEKRWRDLEQWKNEIDEKLARDYHAINRAGRSIGRHQEFERIMLRSMVGVIDHLADGNHADKLQEISRQISEYLIGDRVDPGDDS
jgi:hypothetical protein